jgi:hypothetical protein
MIGNERWCHTCGHRCHCYASYCKKLIGVGMTDKVQECRCKKCKCDIAPLRRSRIDRLDLGAVPSASTINTFTESAYDGGEIGSTGK